MREDVEKTPVAESGAGTGSEVHSRLFAGKEILQLLGLLALVLGLLLLDRSFAAWRDDPRTFSDQNGHYLPANSSLVGVRRLNRPGIRKAVTASGLVLVACSILIFAKDDQIRFDSALCPGDSDDEGN